MQKACFSYDLTQKKILDPLTLSVSLKQLGVLSKASQESLAQNLPEVAHKLDLLKSVQKHLNEFVASKFQD